MWLRKLRDYGYKNLTNVDLYASEETYEDITYVKGEITEVPHDKEYDLIAMHHSFEHMDNPDIVLQHARSLLKKNGLLLIRIPVMGNIVWEKYHTDWYQIDAPRHSFLYTEDAISILCDRNGMCIEKVIYDSADNCMQLSEMYANTLLSLSECVAALKISRKDKRDVIKANIRHKGDQACFYIRKNN